MPRKKTYSDCVKPLCLCGCGQETETPTAFYRSGHFSRDKDFREKMIQRRAKEISETPKKHTCVIWNNIQKKHERSHLPCEACREYRRNHYEEYLLARKIRYASDPELREKIKQKNKIYINKKRNNGLYVDSQHRVTREKRKNHKDMWFIAVNLLIQRDGSVCALCGNVIDIENCSVDHIVPIYAGGDHSATNVRLTHILCNFSRKRPGIGKAIYVTDPSRQ